MNMVINANTKIGSILKHNPAALEAIVSISPKFEKLRNPILRKLMAGRASVSMASKIGGCQIDDFFAKLAPLGFEIDNEAPATSRNKKQAPGFLQTLQGDQVVFLDVRPIMASGKDPLSPILEKIKSLRHGQVLKIQNSFEPTPLMQLLQKQGFDSYATELNDNLVETWFYRNSDWRQLEEPERTDACHDWDEILLRCKDKLQTIDVRDLEMPLPMLTILESLDSLPPETALFVYHKRIPVFLLPELVQRQFDYRIKEITDGEVHLLIFKQG
jgi:uncharacterized protein (DUF2249 family)